MVANDWRIDVSGSPCMLQEHEHSSYAGFAEPNEIVALLCDLEREARADVRHLAQCRRQQSLGTASATVAGLERRRVRHWLMLRRQLGRFRGRFKLSRDGSRHMRPEAFHKTSVALMAERHSAVAACLKDILPRIADDALHGELNRLRKDLQDDSRRLKVLIR
ncbi:hypothetical protein C882_0673 [Caenispirillum salinarum AK4]|uniref:DUF2383 domain-containing protein n=1 Tax=Caenispirillum salinarum AK4 TaxID=1238182 RepID=K9GSD9_9PROT|nr:hypothetical protein [Caenispirillum salinarum]EKV28910.1 hypothetical protein C882_0673 [Caenispirillum salinarum AK4]